MDTVIYPDAESVIKQSITGVMEKDNTIQQIKVYLSISQINGIANQNVTKATACVLKNSPLSVLQCDETLKKAGEPLQVIIKDITKEYPSVATECVSKIVLFFKSKSGDFYYAMTSTGFIGKVDISQGSPKFSLGKASTGIHFGKKGPEAPAQFFQAVLKSIKLETKTVQLDQDGNFTKNWWRLNKINMIGRMFFNFIIMFVVILKSS